ncbi:MFS transporter [Kocuria rosea]|jgi:inositol transporter-like SP family MFS transporter|uniref:Major facilitator transporter n=1 Tax=Kocuria rosea subsp. polaris TaxID=136273 RepID=A0A0A6YCQ2_KOCRO|nr:MULTISPECIES: MFS transporter [Kocuria]MCC5782433.1 MFS transporter [Kocuria sp. CCUG 69068]EYT49242.1 major facilitator transporter [Kocuria sp. UCD-OTCP]KHD97832.1 major facilitator transporter [Kocuria polaris]MCM3486809.1 MFS transporter [Kocuria rosea]MEB2525865.1 MFS transporter [Kocuria rosea]
MTTTKLGGWKATIAVSMSNYIEAGSIIALATSLSLWQEYFGFTNLAVGLVAALSANAFGAALGALIGGPLGDRYGRKFIYTYDLILYMIGTAFVIFAVAPWMLVLGVVLTGIAVGAGVPVAWTYIAEEAPSEARAKHVGTAQFAWSLAPALVFLFATFVVPLGLLGTRIVFAHLFVVAFVTWWVRRGLSESHTWKKSDEERRASEATGIKRRNYRELLTNRTNLKALLFLVGVYALWNLVAGQMGIFMPRVYETAGVESATQQNLLQVLLWSFTVLATWFGFMRYGDRVDRRLLYGIGALLGIAAWVLLVFAHVTMPVLILFAVLWGVSAGIGAQAFYALWAAEMFATRYRASAQGVLFFVARIVVGLLSYWFPTLLAEHGVPFVGMIMIGALLVALLVGVIGAPDTRGKSLEQIEEDRYGTPASRPAQPVG